LVNSSVSASLKILDTTGFTPVVAQVQPNGAEETSCRTADFTEEAAEHCVIRCSVEGEVPPA